MEIQERVRPFSLMQRGDTFDFAQFQARHNIPVLNVMNYFHKFITGASEICVHDIFIPSAVELLKFMKWGGLPPNPPLGLCPKPQFGAPA